MKRLLGCSAALILVALAYFVGIPYPGVKQDLPAVQLVVVDGEGVALEGFHLFVYRCTHPGSQFRHAFAFPDQATSKVTIRKSSHVGIKRAGGVFLSEHVFWPHEPQPYWVACVNKQGYESRRWSIEEDDEQPIRIVVDSGDEPGEDECPAQPSGECTPCRSYEYEFHGVNRYQHLACK